MPPSGGRLHDVGEQERQKARDDKLWVWEVRWAKQYGVTKMRCPYIKCARKGYLVLFNTIHEHLILNGMHMSFRRWKGLNPLDDSDEEWETTSKAMISLMQHEVDEGVNVGQLLDDLFPCIGDKQLDNISNGLNDDLDAYRLKGMDMVQGACDTMEELSAIP
jgi:hypothetical protein